MRRKQINNEEIADPKQVFSSLAILVGDLKTGAIGLGCSKCGWGGNIYAKSFRILRNIQYFCE